MKPLLITAYYVLLMSCVGAHCQTTPEQTVYGEANELTGVVRKNRAPIAPTTPRFVWPDVIRTSLTNGVRLMIVERHTIPTVTIHINVSTSSLDDPPGLEGLAECTAELLLAGTPTLTRRQLSSELADIGATWQSSVDSAGTGTSLVLTGMSHDLPRLMRIVTTGLTTAAFPEREITEWKMRRLARLRQITGSATYLAERKLMTLLYSTEHRTAAAPSAESVSRISRSDVLAFYKAHYTPSATVVGVIGDVRVSVVVNIATANMSEWFGVATAKPIATASVAAYAPTQQLSIIDRVGSAQATIMIGFRAASRSDPDHAPFVVLNEVLGRGSTGRLFRSVREVKGLTYSISSSLAQGRYRDHLSITSSCDTDNILALLKEVLSELSNLRNDAVPEHELMVAKTSLAAQFAIGAESRTTLLRRLLIQETFGLPVNYWRGYYARLEEVTAEHISALATARLRPEVIQVVIVADASKLAPHLAALSEITAVPLAGVVVERDSQHKRKD